MKFNKKFLIFGLLILFISIMGVYSAQYQQETTDLSSIIDNANGDDVFGCCSIIYQIDENHSMMTFRRDSNFTADIKIEKIDWHGIPAIKQYKEEEGYFCHVIITNTGWVIGMGGIDDGEDSQKCEDIAFKMINNDNSINKSGLKEIQKIKEPYGRGHFIIKAPNGNYGFCNINKLKTGTLNPGEYKSVPNNYSLSRSGEVPLDSKDLIGEMVELSQSDQYGDDRRDIFTYDIHLNGSNNFTDVYVSNEDGSMLGEDYTGCVDDVYFLNNLTKAADIPIAPKYMSLGSIGFTDADLNHNNDFANIILVVVVIFIAALSYGVYRLVRFIKSKFVN